MDNKPGRFDHRAVSAAAGANDLPGLHQPMSGAPQLSQRWAAWLGPQRAAATRRQVCTGLLATSAALGLLLAFHQVVSAGVRQAELHHRAAAVLADRTWRCHALRGAELTNQCLAALAAPADPARAGAARPAVLPRLVALSDGAPMRLAR